MAERLPRKLFEKIRSVMGIAHLDECAGVPIGARLVAFEILNCYDDAEKNAIELKLGTVYDIPSEWAREHCLNPVRNMRYELDKNVKCR